MSVAKYRIPFTTRESCTNCGKTWDNQEPIILMCLICQRDEHVICSNCHATTGERGWNLHKFRRVKLKPSKRTYLKVASTNI